MCQKTWSLNLRDSLENLVFECFAVLPLSVVVFLATHLPFEHLLSNMPKNLGISAVWLFFNSFELQKASSRFCFLLQCTRVIFGTGPTCRQLVMDTLPALQVPPARNTKALSGARNTKASPSCKEHQRGIWCRGNTKELPPARNTKALSGSGNTKALSGSGVAPRTKDQGEGDLSDRKKL